MAIQNQIILNGQIKKIRNILNEEKNVIQMNIALLVIRRPQVAVGNKKGDIKTDIVQVWARDKKIIDYLCKHNVTEGDMLEVSGVFCTLRSKKHYICSDCGEKNTYEGSSSFIHPMCVRLDELTSKNVEIINLSESERHLSRDEIMGILRERKTFEGNIIQTKELEKLNNIYRVQVTVMKSPTDEMVKNWLLWMAEISNRIYLIGNLCNDPSYNPIDNGGRVCTYQLGINRKVFIKDDDPNVRADYPWIKSLGEQADKDREALRKGSLVFIEGSVQGKQDFVVKKTCAFCGSVNHKMDSAMEIVPYSVEYLKNCLSIEDDEDSFEEISDFPKMEEDETDDEESEFSDSEEQEDEADEKEWSCPDEEYIPDNREQAWDEGNEDYDDYGFHSEDYGDDSEFAGFSSMYSDEYGEDGDM